MLDDVDATVTLLVVRNDTDNTLVVLRFGDVLTQGCIFGPGLTMLELQGGGLTLTPGANDTVVLPQGVSGIALAEAGSLFPVCSAILDPGQDATAALHATREDTEAMAQALNLVRNLMATPFSQLGVGLVQAFEAAVDGDDQESGADGPDIDAFFAGYQPFQSVDVTRLSLALGWAQGFAFLWGMGDDGETGRSYDVHLAPYLGTAQQPAGHIEFTRSDRFTGVAGPSDCDSAFDIQLTLSNGGARTLHLTSSSFGDGAGASLMPAFIDAAWASTGSKVALVPVLTGQVDGQRIVAVPSPPAHRGILRDAPVADPGSSAGTSISVAGNLSAVSVQEDKQADEMNAADIANMVMAVIGLIASIAQLVGGGKALRDYIKARRAGKQGVDPIEIEKANMLATRVRDAVVERLKADLSKIGAIDDLPTTAEFQDFVAESVKQLKETTDSIASAKAKDVLEQVSTKLEDMAKISNTELIQENMERVFDAQQALEAGQEDLKSKLAEVNKAVTSVNADLPKIMDQLGASLKESVREMVREAMESARETARAAEKMKDETVEEIEAKEERADFVEPVQK